MNNEAIFFASTFKKLGNACPCNQIQVLDFGCGKGDLVLAFLSMGFDAYGCDLVEEWPTDAKALHRFHKINYSQYRLPYNDNSFDFVVSTSVLEHVRNKKQVFQEIHRVLKRGGCAIHIFPSKYYLPYEPHIYVPLANFFYPAWWLFLWAFLGVRNQYQKGKAWDEVVALNHEYCSSKVFYIANHEYRNLSLEIFNNHYSADDFGLEYSSCKFISAILTTIFPRKLISFIYGEIRYYFMIQVKQIVRTA